MKLSLAKTCQWIDADGRFDGLARGTADGYSIDTRTLKPGDLFFAIRGEKTDGHRYVDDALKAGAAAAVVASSYQGAEGDRLMRVDDPTRALQQLAAKARLAWGKPVVAITGSNGKTTTKDATAALLATRYSVAKTEGNLNNQLGVPLSILRAADQADALVLEMGMNHAGEIRELSRIARPDFGVVTNVSAAHIGHFDSIEGVAEAKRELVESLGAEGAAILNADDPRVSSFASAHQGAVVTFGIEQASDVGARDVDDLGANGMRFAIDGVAYECPLIGRHNLYNVLAAIAVAERFDIDPASLGPAIRRLRASKMRGEVHRAGGVTVIDDSYNANPSAMEAMLDVLRRTPGRRHIAVLGEMRELGAQSKDLHRRVGRAVSAAGLDRLITVAGDATEISAVADLPTEFFRGCEAAASALADYLRPGDVVLIKGSRGVGLERARDVLLRSLQTPLAVCGEVS